MSKTFKKGLYTTAEIAAIVFKKCPGRFKNIESAKRRVSYARARLGIADINGKKNFQQFSIKDTERILADIINGKPCKNGKTRKPPRRARVTDAIQISIFDDARIVDPRGGERGVICAEFPAPRINDDGEGVRFEPNVIDWLEPYTPNSKKTTPVIADEPLTAEDLADRLDYLLDEITDTIHALINTIKEDKQNG